MSIDFIVDCFYCILRVIKIQKIEVAIGKNVVNRKHSFFKHCWGGGDIVVPTHGQVILLVENAIPILEG